MKQRFAALHTRCWLLAQTLAAWGSPSRLPGEAPAAGACTPILTPQPALQTLKLTGSDSSRMDWLSDMLYTFLDGSRHEGGNILEANHSMAVVDVQARGLLPIGTVGAQDVIGGLNFLLRTAAMDDDGYVWLDRQSPFWAFPNADHSLGRLPAWRFEQGNSEGWSSVGFSSSSFSNGNWNLVMDGIDPQLLSPPMSVSASEMPFVYLRMLCKDDTTRCAPPSGSNFNYGQIFWKTNVDPSFSLSKSMFFRIPNENEFIPSFPVDLNSHAIPVYQSAEWKNTITGIRIDPVLDGLAGRTLTVGQIEGGYDARMQMMNLNYILAVAQYYFATGDPVIFTSGFPPFGTAFDRARKAMNFVESEAFGLHGRQNNFTLVDWKGHDGRAGIVGQNIQFGKGIAGSTYDILPVGYEDTYASIYYFAALKAIADLEEEALDHPEWGVAPNPYGQSSVTYENQAEAVRAAIASNFWLANKGRLMSCRDADGVIQDPGHVGVNLEAIYFDAISEAQSAEVLEWLSGDRIVSGDLSTGSDIYFWEATPRVTTRDVSAWYSWVMYVWFGVDLNAFPGAHFGQQVQNGGGWYWLSFFDVVSRAKTRGPDDAWERMKAIIDWYKQAQSEGGFRCYFENRGIVKQGCTGAGAIGVDCEFVDSTLVPLAALYGFLGYETGRDGLIFHPRIPSQSPWLGAERLFFRNRYYNVTARRDNSAPLDLTTTPGTGGSAHTLPLRVDGLLAGHQFQVKITDLSTNQVTNLLVTTDAVGTLKGNFNLPASAKLEIKTSSSIFSDGFETGDTSRWSQE